MDTQIGLSKIGIPRTVRGKLLCAGDIVEIHVPGVDYHCLGTAKILAIFQSLVSDDRVESAMILRPVDPIQAQPVHLRTGSYDGLYFGRLGSDEVEFSLWK